MEKLKHQKRRCGTGKKWQIVGEHIEHIFITKTILIAKSEICGISFIITP